MTGKQRYFIQLAYNGANYHGWQVQKNALSVQEVLNKNLSIILRQPIETLGCGRTDAGVHAREFFAHFDAEGLADEIISSEKNGLPPQIIDAGGINNNLLSTPGSEPPAGNFPTLLRSLNSTLPKDIAIKKIFRVGPNAHARFDAVQRAYEYHIHFDKDPFKNGFSWELRDRPDTGLMNKAAAIIREYTDFSCFSKSNTQVKTNICHISAAEWVPAAGGIVFHISADRFLRNMVRAIVGTLLMAGKKEIEPDGIRSIIESKNRSNAGASVPACGLFLTSVSYPWQAE